MFGFLSIALVAKSLCISSRSMSHKVFVYGTLKQNEPNHYWLLNPENGQSVFLGHATTKVKYPLVIATIYNIPFLLQEPGTGHFIKGEVYEVDDKMLSNLDILEEHPKFYVREYDDVQLIDKSSKSVKTIKCWIYFLKQFKPELLKYTMLENYSSSGPHGKPYSEDQSSTDDMYDVKVQK